MADRVEREIEEILRKIDDIGPARGKSAGHPKRQNHRVGQPLNAAQGWIGRTLSHVSLHSVMMWSFFAVIVAFFLRGIPGGFWLMVGALIVCITAFVLSRRGGSTASAPPK